MGITLKAKGGKVQIDQRKDNVKLISPSGGRQYEDYEGAYEVNPLVTTQILETYDKHMIDDLTINMIQTRETVNPSGGVTFEILG